METAVDRLDSAVLGGDPRSARIAPGSGDSRPLANRLDSEPVLPDGRIPAVVTEPTGNPAAHESRRGPATPGSMGMPLQFPPGKDA